VILRRGGRRRGRGARRRGLAPAAALALAAAACGGPEERPATAAESDQAVPVTAEELNCRDRATLPVAGREEEFTRDDAEAIRREVARYLVEDKPPLEPGVFPPGEAFIDCRGTIRMGAWILESASSAEPELRLTLRVATTDYFIVRQIVALRRVEGRWRATGADRETWHRAPR
jgi:hypothetical protein